MSLGYRKKNKLFFLNDFLMSYFVFEQKMNSLLQCVVLIYPSRRVVSVAYVEFVWSVDWSEQIATVGHPVYVLRIERFILKTSRMRLRISSGISNNEDIRNIRVLDFARDRRKTTIFSHKIKLIQTKHDCHLPKTLKLVLSML